MSQELSTVVDFAYEKSVGAQIQAAIYPPFVKLETNFINIGETSKL